MMMVHVEIVHVEIVHVEFVHVEILHVVILYEDCTCGVLNSGLTVEWS